MRINLNCPFSEKDDAKRLGAKWDSEKRVWYIVDPDDLQPFGRWLPVLNRLSNDMHIKKQHKVLPRTTGPKFFVPLCDCDVLPWEDCEHSYAVETQALEEMIGQVPDFFR